MPEQASADPALPIPAPALAAPAPTVDIAVVHPLPRPGALQGHEVNMALYAAIVGKVPQIDPTAGPVLAPPAPDLRPQRPWSPIVLSIYLREAYRQSTLKLTRPEIAAWIRRQSAVAKKRLHETQHRLAMLKNDRAA